MAAAVGIAEGVSAAFVAAETGAVVAETAVQVGAGLTEATATFTQATQAAAEVSNVATAAEAAINLPQGGAVDMFVNANITEPATATINTGANAAVETTTSGASATPQAVETLTDTANTTVVENISPQPIEAPIPSAEMTQRVNTYVDKNMNKWRTDNPRPEKATDPDGYEQWQSNQAQALEGFQQKGQINESMADWDSKTPEPDSMKDPEGHKKWIKDREIYKQGLTEQQELKNQQQETTENGKKTPEEVLEDEAKKLNAKLKKEGKEAQLQELAHQKALLQVLIYERTGLERQDPPPANKLTLLAENGSKLKEVNNKITALEAELGITSKSSIFKAILTMVGVGAVGAIMQASKA